MGQDDAAREDKGSRMHPPLHGCLHDPLKYNPKFQSKVDYLHDVTMAGEDEPSVVLSHGKTN